MRMAKIAQQADAGGASSKRHIRRGCTFSEHRREMLEAP